MSTYQPSPPVNSLVLYKHYPARVLEVGDKIEIECDGGQRKRVRTKDIELLHPGPLRHLSDLARPPGEPEAAWELLEGNETTLQELAELAYDAFTPASAWASWQLVADGLHFVGTPHRIRARAREEVERDRATRAIKAAEEREWKAFLERMSAASPAPEDRERLSEVERLALGQAEHSRVLAALGHEESPDHAHRMLVRVGHWLPNHNPYPARLGVPVHDPELPVPQLREEDRLDLTHLAAYAIDDEGNQDPDDAISIDGDWLWVHVADVAALIDPDSQAEREARARGANLYLPEGIVNMLPGVVTERLGLGLQPVSPALSFGILADDSGEILDLDVQRTWVRVERLSYDWVEQRMNEPPFSTIEARVAPFRARRHALGAVSLDLPEVSVRVHQGRVCIRQMARLASRAMVTDAMLMAGVAAGRFCLERGIPIPFAAQALPEDLDDAPDLAAVYARRRRFKPTRLIDGPEPHAGLGLELYTRATSPLRRYSDLLVHQQIRAELTGKNGVSREEMLLRVAEAESAAALVRRGERFSNQHWKHVFLRDDPGWRGEATVVEREERKVTVLIPTLAFEAKLRCRELPLLNERVRVSVTEVDVPALSAGFRVV